MPRRVPLFVNEEFSIIIFFFPIIFFFQQELRILQREKKFLNRIIRMILLFSKEIYIVWCKMNGTIYIVDFALFCVIKKNLDSSLTGNISNNNNKLNR